MIRNKASWTSAISFQWSPRTAYFKSSFKIWITSCMRIRFSSPILRSSIRQEQANLVERAVRQSCSLLTWKRSTIARSGRRSGRSAPSRERKRRTKWVSNGTRQSSSMIWTRSGLFGRSLAQKYSFRSLIKRQFMRSRTSSGRRSGRVRMIRWRRMMKRVSRSMRATIRHVVRELTMSSTSWSTWFRRMPKW